MECSIKLCGRRPTIVPPFSVLREQKSSRLTPSCSQLTPQETGAVTTETQLQDLAPLRVKFQTLRTCKLGISRYPNFDYNAEGGRGVGAGGKKSSRDDLESISVSFDERSLYIPPLDSSTTRFLGLPLPPFVRIEIVPAFFGGTIDRETGQVDLEFKANFLFSVGTIYRAPPLVVQTVLTSEESKGEIKQGRGERMDKEGSCRLVGVATVDPIDDIFLNSFLGLPTECLADLRARISIAASA